jgi:hypothetical protein
MYQIICFVAWDYFFGEEKLVFAADFFLVKGTII